VAGFGRSTVGLAARGVEWTTDRIGAMMPNVTIGGGQMLPPEPPSERPYSGYAPKATLDFEPDMSPSWLYAFGYIAGGRIWAVDGMKEGWRTLGRYCPDVKAWALALTETERGLVRSAGCEAMDAHLRGEGLIPGVRTLAARNRKPDGILGDAPAKKPVVFELDDGWDMSTAPMTSAL
jgi:hypothetical protein